MFFLRISVFFIYKIFTKKRYKGNLFALLSVSLAILKFIDIMLLTMFFMKMENNQEQYCIFHFPLMDFYDFLTTENTENHRGRNSNHRIALIILNSYTKMLSGIFTTQRHIDAEAQSCCLVSHSTSFFIL